MTKLGKGQHNKYIIPVKVERMLKSKSDANMGGSLMLSYGGHRNISPYPGVASVVLFTGQYTVNDVFFDRSQIKRKVS